MEPILTSQGITYKRNVLLICVIASLSMLDGIDISKAKVFDLEVGNHLWSVGLALLIYHLISFVFEARQGWLIWDDVKFAKKPTIIQLFGFDYFQIQPERKQDYSLERLRKVNGIYNWYKFYYKKDGTPIMQGGRQKVSSVTNTGTSEKFKLRKMQFLHFIFLDVLPVVVSCIVAGKAYFKHG